MEKMMVKINQMKKMNCSKDSIWSKSAEVRQTRAGKNYLAFVFQDETGTIEGKLWDAQPHNVESFTAGRVVHMAGRREVYNNTPQVNPIEYALATSRRAQQSSRLQGKTTSRSQGIAWIPVKHDFQNWKSSLATDCPCPLYGKYEKEFYSYPAAKTNHHAFEAGLAYHTATMVRLADSIGDIYPQLNKSLLFAGIMLHDLAKVIELTGPENTEYTVRGNLIGHIALIDEEITKVLQDLKIDDQKKKWSSFAMWSWVTMACSNTVVPFVQKSWKQRLFIWSIIWMRKWWWWQQHLA